MTEGIIQKVFSRYLEPEYLPNAILTIEGLQKELISEIKKEVLKKNKQILNNNSFWDDQDILEILIGDNQE